MSSAFRFHHRLQVRFRDCDIFGHVNNAVYFTYMEEARWAYWRELMGESYKGSPGLILARAECDFLLPVRPGERLDIWLGTTTIGRSSFTIDSEIVGEAGSPVARGKAVMVAYDYAAAGSLPIPDWCRARIEEYEGRNLSRAARV